MAEDTPSREGSEVAPGPPSHFPTLPATRLRLLTHMRSASGKQGEEGARVIVVAGLVCISSFAESSPCLWEPAHSGASKSAVGVH